MSSAKYSSHDLKLIKTQKMLPYPMLYNHNTDLSLILHYGLPLSERSKQTSRGKARARRPIARSFNARFPQHQAGHYTRWTPGPPQTRHCSQIPSWHAIWLVPFCLCFLFCCFWSILVLSSRMIIIKKLSRLSIPFRKFQKTEICPRKTNLDLDKERLYSKYHCNRENFLTVRSARVPEVRQERALLLQGGINKPRKQQLWEVGGPTGQLTSTCLSLRSADSQEGPWRKAGGGAKFRDWGEGEGAAWSRLVFCCYWSAGT